MPTTRARIGFIDTQFWGDVMPEGKGHTRSEHGPVGKGNGTNAPGNRGGGAGGTVGDNEKGTGFGGVLDKVFGYENLGQRRKAYRNNPNVRGNQKQTGLIPSYPNASPVYAAASFLDAPLGPAGWAGMAARLADAISGGTGEGTFAGMAREAGFGPGERGPDVAGGGYDREGKGQSLAPWMKTPATAATAPITAPAADPISKLPEVQVKPKAPWMMQQMNLAGPSPYGFIRPIRNW